MQDSENRPMYITECRNKNQNANLHRMLGQVSCMGLYKTDKYGPVRGMVHASRQVSTIS